MKRFTSIVIATQIMSILAGAVLKKDVALVVVTAALTVGIGFLAVAIAALQLKKQGQGDFAVKGDADDLHYSLRCAVSGSTMLIGYCFAGFGVIAADGELGVVLTAIFLALLTLVFLLLTDAVGLTFGKED